MNSFSTSNIQIGSNPILNTIRKTSWDHFSRLGFPDRRHEEWKYNRIDFVKDGNWQIAADTQENTPTTPRHNFKDCYRIQFLNTLPQSLPDIPGVHLSRISSLTENATLLQQFNRLVQVEVDAFAALNTALFRDGLCIEISANAIIDKPIVIEHSYSGTQQSWYQPRILLVAGENSQCKIIEMQIGDTSTNTMVNVCTEIFLEANAQLEWDLVQEFNDGFYLVNKIAVAQKDNSIFRANTLSLKGNFTRNNLEVSYWGEHCNCFLNGVYYTNGVDICDNHLSVDHRYPNSESNQLYKGVLNGESTAIFNGKIYVQKDAQKTNAYQSNKNLLLSSEATINSKPQLEIFADDVKCSHGATSGQLDEQALFYLMSRGIDKSAAEAILSYAFVSEVVEKISISELRDYCSERLQTYLSVAKG